MPWYFPWSDSIKKRAVRYLLQHYMGHFLKEKIGLDQLTVDLYSGTGTAKDILLDVAYLNEALEASGIPLEIVDGYIGSITVTIPWSALVNDNTIIDISDLELTIKPKYREDIGGVPLDSMLFSSMTTSMQLAEECLRQEPTEGELRATDAAQPFEGLELFAQTIDAVLSKIKVSFNATVVRLEHVPKDCETGMSLEIRIARMEYFDDLASGQCADEPPVSGLPAIAVKNLHLTGVKAYCDEFPAACRTASHLFRSESLCFDPFSTGQPSSHEQTFYSAVFPSDGSAFAEPSCTTSQPVTSQPASGHQKTLSDHLKPCKEPELVVLIAELTSRQEVKLRIKQNDDIPGAKLELDCSIGCVNIHLSPHLVHLLLEIASGLSSPVMSDEPSRRSVNKPMTRSEMEHQLLKHLQQECNASRQPMSSRDRVYSESSEMMTNQPLDDSDDEVYMSIANNDSATDSTLDMSTCSMSTSQTSSTAGSSVSFHKRPSLSGPAKSRSKPARRKDALSGRHHHTIDDTCSEFTRFKLKVAFLSVVILHEDPAAVLQDSSEPAATSVDRLREIADKYFDSVRRDISIAGVSTPGGLAQLRKAYSKACPVDHLGLLCKPINAEVTKHNGPTSHSVTADLSFGLFELIEAVFDQRHSTASLYGFHLPIENVLPEYTEIVTFVESEKATAKMMSTSMYASLVNVSPCIRLHFKSDHSVTRTSKRSSSIPKTDIEMELTHCQCEVDITVVDRIHALLNPRSFTARPVNSVYRSFQPSVPMQSKQALFTQAIDEDSLSIGRKFDLQIDCSQITFRFRFPKVDLRVGVDKPWWRRSLHPEQLSLELDSAKFKTGLDNSSSVTQLELRCRSGRGLFHKCPSATAVSFLQFSGGSTLSAEQDAGFDWPRLVVKQYALKQSVLEDVMVEVVPPNDPLNGACQLGKTQPSPFSSRKVMYENEELLMPGDKQDVGEFLESAVANTQLHLDLTIPNVSVFLSDRDFFEVMYNRLLNDLVLWEPMAPKPIDTQDTNTFMPGSAWSPQLVAQLMHQGPVSENFSTCKSGIQYESSSESDDADDDFYSMSEVRRRNQGHQWPDRVQRQSRLCVTVNINKGRLIACTASQSGSSEVCRGRLLLEVDDGSVLAVIGQNGDPDLQLLCIQLHRAELHHNGDIVNDVVPTSVEFLTSNHCGREHLQPTVRMSEDGICSRLNGKVGKGPDTEDMVTVAIRINTDTLQNIKKYVVAFGIRSATLQHRNVDSSLMWYKQIMDFFNVKDFEIPGYSLPQVVVELHTHLWSCAIDYRPLYLKYRALVTMETFSILSNVVIDSPVSLLRFLLDDGALYLSDKVYAKEIDVKKNYVCVMDVGMFEISLRTTNTANTKYPKMDIRASNNIVHIWTCSDSCYALMELINYLSSDGDLAGSVDEMKQTTRAETPVSVTTPAGDDSRTDDSSKISQKHLEQVHDMVADAMLDLPPAPNIKESASKTQATNVYCYPADVAEELRLSDCSSSRSSLALDSVAGSNVADGLQSAMSDQSCDSDDSVPAESFDDFEDFCIIDEPGLGIMPKDGEPVIRMLTSEPIVVIDNYFRTPIGKTDMLKAPDHFPCPVYRYALSEISIVWSMYGGRDFESSAAVRTSRTNSPKLPHRPKPDVNTLGNLSWRSAGGPGRDPSTLMELQLNKIRIQHEVYPDNTLQASRQVLIISDLEIRDRLALSKINKFLYHYSSDAVPRQSHASMLVIRALHVRPDQTVPTQECMLKVSLQPLRLNVDQDSLFFFRSFFNDISSRFSAETESTTTSADAAAGWLHHDPASLMTSPKHASNTAPVMTVGGDIVSDVHDPSSAQLPADADEMLLILSGMNDASTDMDSSRESQDMKELNAVKQAPIFFKSFVFSPEVLIRLDYQGKWVDMEQGTLAGLVVGLAQLNCSELRLKPINYRHGLLGVDRVVAFAVTEWLQDIKKNQLPSLLGGVGPLYSLVQLVHGCRDLFWLPVEQYRRDGRIVRGFQRGAQSFMTCTAMSTLELTNRVVQTIQFAAESAYDMVSPGPSVRVKRRMTRRPPRRFAQPIDLREGVSNAVNIITGGLCDAATNIYSVAVQEHEHKGVTGAVGGVLRQIPSAVIEPVIIATEATSNVLGGMRNQLLPDRKLEDDQKWKQTDSD